MKTYLEEFLYKIKNSDELRDFITDREKHLINKKVLNFKIKGI